MKYNIIIKENRAIGTATLISMLFSIAVFIYAKKHGFYPGALWIEYTYTSGLAVILASLVKLIFIALESRNSDKSLIMITERLLKKLSPNKVIRVVLWSLAISMTMGSFTAYKSLMPYDNPFSYDERFMQLDLLIFQNIAPWKLTHSMFENPISSWVIMQYYHLSFVIFWCCLAASIISRRLRKIRSMICLSTILSFIMIGCIAANYFSSAGPCYYKWVKSGSDPYQELRSRLEKQNLDLRRFSESMNLYSLDAQDYLLSASQAGRLVYGGGISAMPSMHVSTAVLAMIIGIHIGRVIGVVFALGVLLTWVGSIHLGWHYSVDGIVAFTMTLMIYKLTSVLVRLLSL